MTTDRCKRISGSVSSVLLLPSGLFSTMFTLNYFFVVHAVRVCVVCLPWMSAGLACSGARLPSDVYTTRGTMVTV